MWFPELDSLLGGVKAVKMRGTDGTSSSQFSYVDLEDRIPAKFPLCKFRQVVNDVLTSLNTESDGRYAAECCPPFAPERLIRASLIQNLFSIRSERQLMERMPDNLLFRWFVRLRIDDLVWVPTVCWMVILNIRQFATRAAQGDQAGQTDRHVARAGTRYDRGVHGGPQLGGSDDQGCHGGGAEVEARARGDLPDGRGSRPRLPSPGDLTA